MMPRWQEAKMLQRLNRVFSLLSLSLLVSSCGQSGGPSADIGIAITPNKVFLVPGSGSSCVAYAAAKVEGESIVARDLSEERAYFQNFSLQWRSPDALTISEMVVELSGSAFASSESRTIQIAEDEIQALTGLKDLTIERDANRSSTKPYTLDSNSTQRKGPADPYAPCGLHISGISTDPKKDTGNVVFRVTIRGYATDQNGNQRPVRQSTTARAEKL
jgi:hypothetical protein